MAIHTPILMQPATGDSTIFYTEQEWRNYIRGMVAISDGFEGQEGVLGTTGTTSSPSGAYVTTQRAAGANFSVDVAAGKALIRDDDITSGGTYFVWMDATTNVATPTAPVSGTRLHRLVLQIQNKSENGVWTGYTMAPTIVQDTGSGFPAQPASAITIAQISISAGQASVQNSNITDYRETVGTVFAEKSADTSRTGTSMTDDPHLQLTNLASNAVYAFQGMVKYDGGTGGSETDIQWTFRQPGGQIMRYAAIRINVSGNFVGGTTFNGGDTVQAQTTGVGNSNVATLNGIISTAGAPNYSVLQWGANTNTGTNTTVAQYSWLRAARVA